MKSVCPSTSWLQLGEPALFESPVRSTIPQPPLDGAAGMHACWAPATMLHGVATGSPESTTPPALVTALFHSRSNHAICDTTPVAAPGSAREVEFHEAPIDDTRMRSPVR